MLRRRKGHHNMNTDCTMSRIIAGALLTGGIAVAGLGLAAGAAQANPPGCSQYSACWCPGQRMPAGGNVIGDWT
jgi:hypothetical protein